MHYGTRFEAGMSGTNTSSTPGSGLARGGN